MTRMRLILPILVLMAAALACNLPVKKRVSAPDATMTAVIAAVHIKLTETADAIQLVQTEGTPVPSDTGTAIVLPTNTFQPPADTATPFTRCNWAQFVADVTIPDGAQMVPGAAFTKTWRLKNIGTCTWNTDYTLSFDSGAAMGAPASVQLPEVVPPGDTIDISVNLTAPTDFGRKTGYWKLRNPAGIAFGTGFDGQGTFYVQIQVTSGTATVTATPTRTLTPTPTATPTITTTAGSPGTAYDFTTNFCSAEWRSDAGVLPCPGTNTDSKGFVLKVDNPQLQDGSTKNLPGLWMHPQWIQNGVISGRYPAFKVQAGDHFRATLACLYGALLCDVRFQLNYRADGGSLLNFGQWDILYEGNVQVLDLDLSSLAGKNVEFSLAVMANGSPQQDWAFWWQPKIVR